MDIIKLPSSITLLFAGFGAFWIAGFINPGFHSIGVMILLLVPVFIADKLFPETIHQITPEVPHSTTISSEEAIDELVSPEN